MKVIDLLNKIANGEETHFDTKLNDKSVSVRYYNDRNFSSSTDPEMLTIADIIKSLNDEVEIIEEDKKIRKICTFPGLDDDDYAYEDGNRPNNVKINNKIEELLIDKINEIIDYLEEKDNE